MFHRIASPLAIALALVVSVVVASEAAAEKVYASSKTPIYDRPGEMARIVTRVSAGTELKVLRKPKGDTRWYKVRANGRTGWVPRSKVTTRMSASSRKSKRKSRRRAFVEGRSKRRGSLDKDAPDDRVGVDTISDDDDEEIIDEDDDEEEVKPRPRKRRAKKKRRRVAKRVDDDDDDEDEEEEDDEDEDDEGDDDDEEEDEKAGGLVLKSTAAIFRKPSRKSDEVTELDGGDKVWVIKESKSGRWLKVQTAEGETGWVRASKVEESAYIRPKYSFDATAGLGFSLRNQAFTSNGPANNALSGYEINAPTITIGVGGVFTYDYKPDWVLGADLEYRYGRGTPGIRYTAGDMSTDTPFTTHHIGLGARAGYKISKPRGMILYGRVGYIYQNITIDGFNDVEKNPLLLPNENMKPFVVGARFDAPKLYGNFAASIGADYFLPSQRVQTEMLEDGDTADVTGFTANARVVYHWNDQWDLTGMYDFGSITTTFAGAATRPTDATAAERKDTSHTVTVGVLRPFF